MEQKSQKTLDNSVPLDKNKELHTMKLLTLDKIYEEYPKVKTDLKWTKEDIVVFFESKILLGKFDPESSVKHEDLLIESDSLEGLISYHKNISNPE
ncbi:MAG: hypothetical protein JKY42_12110 [Flavobacteriales bacterium]|nr:hypothetical protein [Flavobacteriales bacterium]